MQVFVAAAWFGLGASPAAGGGSLFGSVEFRAGPLPLHSEWRQVFERIEGERPLYDACSRSRADCRSPAALAWERLLSNLAERPEIKQLDGLNQFINGWRYKADRRNGGRGGRWATPLEFFRQSGDCEDYAIAKYVTLRRLGVRANRLRIVVVRDVARRTSHAVLAVHLGDGTYILDNLTDAVRPEVRVRGYTPIYAVNETGHWVYVAPVDDART